MIKIGIVKLGIDDENRKVCGLECVHKNRGDCILNKPTPRKEAHVDSWIESRTGSQINTQRFMRTDACIETERSTDELIRAWLDKIQENLGLDLLEKIIKGPPVMWPDDQLGPVKYKEPRSVSNYDLKQAANELIAGCTNDAQALMAANFLEVFGELIGINFSAVKK
ncbi:MAG: hypothetical protein GWM98_04840 [Nitrospinaceae bacterium]|nr:hypothetical protein [Nitrospinaceae bacterium]